MELLIYETLPHAHHYLQTPLIYKELVYIHYSLELLSTLALVRFSYVKSKQPFIFTFPRCQ